MAADFAIDRKNAIAGLTADPNWNKAGLSEDDMLKRIKAGEKAYFFCETSRKGPKGEDLYKLFSQGEKTLILVTPEGWYEVGGLNKAGVFSSFDPKRIYESLAQLNKACASGEVFAPQAPAEERAGPKPHH